MLWDGSHCQHTQSFYSTAIDLDTDSECSDICKSPLSVRKLTLDDLDTLILFSSLIEPIADSYTEDL